MKKRKNSSASKAFLWILTSLYLGFIMVSCNRSITSSPFIFTEDADGFSLSEGGKPVYYYRKAPKSLTGEYICNNYLHPLYSMEGDTLTEEFPGDHPFHRGIFWAWHQLYMGERNLGDGWTNQGISYEVTSVKAKADTSVAVLETTVLWKSDSLENKKSFIEEHTVITVYREKDEGRKIGFEINLNPLSEGIEIGGSADEKGYGGFCARIKMPDDLRFISGKDTLTPQNTQIEAGDSMTFSGTFGNNAKQSSLTIISGSENPGPYGKWILRQKGSMQNAVFPGKDRIKLEKPLTLRYFILIHQ